MIGFEVEIDLPVTDANGDPINGETDLANGVPANNFVLTTDARGMPDGSDYSNLEFVTTAKNAVGPAAQGAFAAQTTVLNLVRATRDDLYRANTGLLSNASAHLQVLPAGQTAMLAGDNGYEETAGQPGKGDGLFVHYSVGVPLRGMPGFFNSLRTAAPDDAGTYLRQARFRLRQARTFGERIAELYDDAGGAANDVAELNGFAQLAYMQICAMADHIAADEDDDAQIKNATVVLSRVALADVNTLLEVDAKVFLGGEYRAKAKARNVLEILKNLQRVNVTGDAVAFPADSTRGELGVDVTLQQYAESAFLGAPNVEQQNIFGGMHERDAHSEPNTTVMLVPVEIRTIGALEKSWAQVSTDLRNLCTWAQTAYQASR